MAQAENKSNDGDKVTVFYWHCNFRGHFSKLILTYAGVNFKEVTDYQEIKPLITGPMGKRPFPAFAVPIIKVDFADANKDPFYISQMPAGAAYLGRKYGLEPENSEDASHALMMVLNCNDILVEITRNNGHQMWTYEDWTKWRNDRLLRWFGIFESTLNKNKNNSNNNNEQICLFGTKVSYADLAVFHILDRFINHLYPNNNDWIKTQFPMSWKLHQQISSVESIKKFVNDHKDWPFCGGQIEKSILSMIKKELEDAAK